MRWLVTLAAAALATGQASDWIAMGQGGSVRNAAGATTFNYEIRPRQLSIAVRPAVGGLAGVSRFRFRVKSDHDTAIGVLLSEKKPGGGNYTALVWAPANQWQPVELTPSDFTLSDGPADPQDSDGRLDLEQVEGIGIFDFAQFVAAMPAIPNLLVEKTPGAHVLMVDNFEVRTGDAPRREPLMIDRFDRGFLEWMTLGGMQLKLAGAGPLAEPAIEASYAATSEQLSILTRRLSNLDLSSATRIAFDIASEREATILVALEMKNPGHDQGARFNLTIFPPGERKLFHVNLGLDDFQRDQNSADGTLDPSRLKSVSFIDISGPSGGDNGPNTLWIGNVRALAK
ncbi:MAG TPA: hypothetical protein VNX18_01440 [Bryobacteraceae bacterium]|nr:hypothetical protein [Bryobacteraceae bacterium]